MMMDKMKGNVHDITVKGSYTALQTDGAMQGRSSNRRQKQPVPKPEN